MINSVIKRDLTQPGGLCDDLTSFRQAAGYSGKQLAEMIGMNAPTLSRIETGQRLPTLPQVRAYLEACGASPAEQERTTNKLAEVLRRYPEAERQRRSRKRHADNETLAAIPEPGPLRKAYFAGYAAAIRDMQDRLDSLLEPPADEN